MALPEERPHDEHPEEPTLVAVERDNVLVEPLSPQFLLTRRIIYYVLDAFLILLAFRFVLRAFSANAGSLFVEFIYSVTDPLVFPFSGIFPTTSLTSGSQLEWPVLVAMAVYAVLAYGIVRLLRILSTPRTT